MTKEENILNSPRYYRESLDTLDDIEAFMDKIQQQVDKIALEPSNEDEQNTLDYQVGRLRVIITEVEEELVIPRNNESDYIEHLKKILERAKMLSNKLRRYTSYYEEIKTDEDRVTKAVVVKKPLPPLSEEEAINLPFETALEDVK